jgi:hypothetical protein
VSGTPPSALEVLEGFCVEAVRQMTGMCPKRLMVRPWVYPKSADVLAVVRLNPVATHIRQHRHLIVTTINRSSSCLLWWQREIDLEEEDYRTDGGGGEGGYLPPPLTYMTRRETRWTRRSQSGQSSRIPADASWIAPVRPLATSTGKSTSTDKPSNPCATNDSVIEMRHRRR